MRVEQVAQAAELSAKLARTIIRAMRNVVEIMVHSSFPVSWLRSLSRPSMFGPFVSFAKGRGIEDLAIEFV